MSILILKTHSLLRYLASWFQLFPVFGTGAGRGAGKPKLAVLTEFWWAHHSTLRTSQANVASLVGHFHLTLIIPDAKRTIFSRECTRLCFFCKFGATQFTFAFLYVCAVF